MTKHLLDHDQNSGLTEYFIPHSDGKGYTIETVQDVAPVLDINKAEQNERRAGWSPTGDMVKVASIPNVVIHEWLKRGISIYDRNDWPKIKQMLNSGEYLWLRTSNGKI